jgi:GT2 family glycosyltransferase
MDISIIIINYNTFNLTSHCIESVIKYTRDVQYEIILVDNASSECDPALLLAQFPSVKLIKSNKNGGFAYGNNLGIQNASGQYILLLNSDTLLTENSISNCIEYFSKQPAAGVLGCRMIFPGGKVQYSARRFRSIKWELLDLFRFIPFMMPYRKRAGVMLGKYFRHDENMEADWVNGAFFMFYREIINHFPNRKLDDRFFMYGEDQLWCEQIKDLGYRILFYAGTTIIHLNSGSTDIKKQLSLRKLMMRHELQIMRMRKGSGFYYFLFKMIYVTKESARNLIKKIFYRSTGKLIQ